jgi:hypothetical protein
MANPNKTVFVGTGGKDIINKTHFVTVHGFQGERKESVNWDKWFCHRCAGRSDGCGSPL